MEKISYAVKLEPGLAEKVREFCLSHGIKQGFFVEKALREQLSREEATDDMMDFKILKNQEAESIPLNSYLDRKKKHVSG